MSWQASAPFALLLAALLAGCASTGEDDHEHALDLDTFTLEAEGVPAHVGSGESYTFTLAITTGGDAHASSTHLGGHMWPNSTVDPTGDIGLAASCAHIQEAEQVPGTFQVTCTPADDGVHYVRGHLRVVAGEAQLNYWTEEFAVHVGTEGMDS